IEFDFSKVRIRDWGPSQESNVAATVGEADDFIASTQTQAARFTEWAEQKGFSANTETEFLEFLWRNAEQVETEDMIVPAIAAFGEFLRSRGQGIWSKSTLVNPGEPIISRPFMPWLNRRVILEVLKALDTDADG